MDSRVATVCIIIAVLGVLSAALGFAAEATRMKGYRIHSPALGLGVTAAVLAVAVRITIEVYAGVCTCCQRGPLFIVSWIASVIAVILLLVAAGLNKRQGCEVEIINGVKKTSCSDVKGVFSTGAVLSFASAFLGIAAILTLNSSRQAGTAAGNIPMGMHPPVAAANYNIDPEKRPVPQQYY